MPIDIREFEDADPEDLRAEGRTNAEQLLEFFLFHPDQAFTRKEAQDATGIPRESIWVLLYRLKELGIVRQKGHYWALDGDHPLSQAIIGNGAVELIPDGEELIERLEQEG